MIFKILVEIIMTYMFKTKTHYDYIIIMIDKESYINNKSYKDSIRIVITHEDCGNIEIQNNLWYNAINSTNLNFAKRNIPTVCY
jgi:hypothetical protein